MPRQENSAAFSGANRREQIGFAGKDAAPRRCDTEAVEITGNPINEVEVRVRRNCVEGNQALKDVERRG